VGRYEIRGAADILCYPNDNPNGITIHIEVKRPGGRQSSFQKAYEAQLRKRNVPYILVDSVEELKERLMEYGGN
jgi:hypothetical protein